MTQTTHDQPTVFQIAFNISHLPNKPKWQEALAEVQRNYGSDFAKAVSKRAAEIYQKRNNRPMKIDDFDIETIKGNLRSLIED